MNQKMSTHTAAQRHTFASVVPAPPAEDRRSLPVAAR